MAEKPALSVTAGLESLPRLLRFGSGQFTDVASSSNPSKAPIVCGIWSPDDAHENDEVFTAEADEVKFVTEGESIWRDVGIGKTFVVNKGDMLWIPKGSSVTMVSCKNLSAFYVEASHREVSRVTKSAADFDSALGQLVDRLTGEYLKMNPKSKTTFDEALAFLPGSNTRSVLYYGPFPLVLKSGRECYVTSVDGREYVDFVSEFSAGMLGHSHPEIAKVVESTMARGISLGGPSTEEVKLASLLTARFPSMEKVRFCNSGTEANTMALTVCRLFTNRTKIMVFKSAYHGGFLGFADEPMPTTLPFDFVMGTFNDIEQTEQVIDNSLAAIIVEPVIGGLGLVPARRDFLQFLRDAADRTGAVLIFDEVVTSRLHHSGMQGYHGITPDMTTAGKFLGGGFSFGVFGGKSEIMEILDPRTGHVPHSGTFNNNAFSMRAGAVACELITEEVIAFANQLGERLRDGINQAGRFADPPVISATGYGSMIGIHFAGQSAPKLLEAFFLHMLEEGIYIGRRGFFAINMMHRETHIKQALDGVRRFLEALFVEDFTD